MFAFAFFDEIFIFNILMACLTKEPGPVGKQKICIKMNISTLDIPFHFFCWLCNKKPDCIRWQFGSSWVDWNFWISSILRLYFYGQEQQLQFHKTEPESWKVDLAHSTCNLISLWCLTKGHPGKSWGQSLSVHLTTSPL